MSSLKTKTVHGVKWTAIEQASIYGVRFVLGVILARLLTPSDYGITGLIAVFLAVSQVFVNSGFTSALIQRKTRSEKDFATVFYFNIIIAVFCWTILSLSRNWFAVFFNEPLLSQITPVIGLNLIINALGQIQRTRLTIEMNFKAQAKVALASTLMSGAIGIFMAYRGYGVWSLVYQSVSRTLLNAIFLWFAERWIPREKFSKESFKNLFSYGSKLMVSGLLDAFFTNIYSLLIGRFFSSADLGFYNRANQFKNLPAQNLTQILGKVSFPALCSIQDNEKKLLATFRMFLQLTLFISMPIMGTMMVLSRPLIIFTLKEQWAPSIPLLHLLCIVGVMYPIHALNLAVLKAKGRSDLFLKLDVIKKSLTLISLVITFSISVKAMVIGTIIVSFLGLYINTHYTKKILDFGFVEQFKDFLPILILSSITSIITYFSISLIKGDLFQLLLGSLISITFYISGAYLFKFKELTEMKSILRILR